MNNKIPTCTGKNFPIMQCCLEKSTIASLGNIPIADKKDKNPQNRISIHLQRYESRFFLYHQTGCILEKVRISRLKRLFQHTSPIYPVVKNRVLFCNNSLGGKA